jgi:hypothetical protein
MLSLSCSVATILNHHAARVSDWTVAARVYDQASDGTGWMNGVRGALANR